MIVTRAEQDVECTVKVKGDYKQGPDDVVNAVRR